MIGAQELLVLALIIAVFHLTGLWPAVIRGIRQLRGEEPVDTASSPKRSREEVELCYRMLGLTPSATWKEIETAYRKKAQRHHPDHGGDPDTMRALNEAYTYLKQVRKNRK